MRYGQAEKMELIRMVEDSEISVKATLRELDVSKSTFYRWYMRYKHYGYDGGDHCPESSGTGSLKVSVRRS